MSKNLIKFLKDTADAIREKTGKSELIKPVDFAEEIKSISAGGGESEGSYWHYFDVSEVDLTDPDISFSAVLCYMMMKWTFNDEVGIGTASVYEMLSGFAGENNKPKVIAFGGDYTQRVIINGTNASYGDLVEELKAYGISLPEITKEQFYALE